MTKSLSARLLLLTMAFVMIAEVLIYVPSISRYRKVYLEERVDHAQLAMLALEATPDHMVSKALEAKLLMHASAYGITITYPARQSLMLSESMPPQADVSFDIRAGSFVMWIEDAFKAMARDDNRVMRVIGSTPNAPDAVVEITLDEAPMRMAMLDYSKRIFELSLLISLVTAGLVFVALQWLLVRPMGRITQAMTTFRANPEDARATLKPSTRTDEIGTAERELVAMQDDLRVALKQKQRLATLGAAVAKVNHDLRNSLATAVLASGKLADIDDPEVKKLAPRLYAAIDRAVDMCSGTLDFVGDSKAVLRPALFYLHDLIAEAGAEGVIVDNAVPVALQLDADEGQMLRVFQNLILNAAQAGASTVRVEVETDDHLRVLVRDDGPGLNERARENLFEPFKASSRNGGTGLGLAIARDIARAHGGDLELLSSDPIGSVFAVTLPMEVVS